MMIFHQDKFSRGPWRSRFCLNTDVVCGVEFPAFKQQARKRRQQKVGEISLGEDLDALINLLELALGIADLREPLPKGRWPKRAYLFFDQMPEAMTCIAVKSRDAQSVRAPCQRVS